MFSFKPHPNWQEVLDITRTDPAVVPMMGSPGNYDIGQNGPTRRGIFEIIFRDADRTEHY
jgi:hypothetical protein